jgi:hypothetical protein
MHQGQAPTSDLTFMLSADDDAALTKASVELSGGVYPYSVIPGGVQSAAEFAAKRESDPVVAKHYSGVSLAALHVERVTEPRLAYMSYRINDRIYWTKSKLQLSAGETILTDGETTIRGRCGNGVSDVAMLPVSDQEPEAAAFDRRSDNPIPTAVAGLWDAGNDGRAGVAGMGSGSAANGSASPQLMARNDMRSAGGGSVGSGSGGGGLAVPSSYTESTGARSTSRSSSRGGDDATTQPGGGDGSNAPGGGAGSNPPGGGGGSNAPGGGAGSNTPGGGGGSNPPGNSNGPTNRSGGGGPDTSAFGAPNGDPSAPGDLPGRDAPPNLGQVSVNAIESSDPESVPEPSSILLLAGGMTGYALRRIRARRRRN